MQVISWISHLFILFEYQLSFRMRGIFSWHSPGANKYDMHWIKSHDDDFILWLTFFSRSRCNFGLLAYSLWAHHFQPIREKYSVTWPSYITRHVHLSRWVACIFLLFTMSTKEQDEQEGQDDWQRGIIVWISPIVNSNGRHSFNRGKYQIYSLILCENM